MQWYERAAQLTESYVSNKRYNEAGFATILAKYDSDKNRIINKNELHSLLSKMLARYETQISLEEAQDILTGYNASAGISIQELARLAVRHRNKTSETYTRLLSNMLSHSEQYECTNTYCVTKDPFAPSQGGVSALKDYLCNGSQVQNATQKNMAIGSSTPASKQTDSPALSHNNAALIVTEEQTQTIDFDPFAGLASNGLTQSGTHVNFLTEHSHAHEGETPLEIWNEIQEHGACSGDHCAKIDPQIQNAITAIGKHYNPVIHTVESTDVRDTEIAKALGAPIWAQFENQEVMATTFNTERDFNPAPVIIHNQFAQSPLLGFQKGALAKKQPLKAFIDEGAHNETTHYDRAGTRYALRYSRDNGIETAGIYNFGLDEKQSHQLSGVLSNSKRALRFDTYRTLNAKGTIGVGGTVLVDVQKTAPTETTASGSFVNYQFNPMIYKATPHYTYGTGILIGNQGAQLRTDFSMLDWWTARNAFRLQSTIGEKSSNTHISFSSETSHFLRPTYEFSYSLSTQKQSNPLHSFEGEYKNPFSPHHGAYAEMELLNSKLYKSFELSIGSAHSFGRKQNWAAGPEVRFVSQQNNTPTYMMGGHLSMLNVKDNISFNLNAGISKQKNQKYQPNLSIAVQYTGKNSKN